MEYIKKFIYFNIHVTAVEKTNFYGNLHFKRNYKTTFTRQFCEEKNTIY